MSTVTVRYLKETGAFQVASSTTAIELLDLCLRRWELDREGVCNYQLVRKGDAVPLDAPVVASDGALDLKPILLVSECRLRVVRVCALGSYQGAH
jgi:hypothetical protein